MSAAPKIENPLFDKRLLNAFADGVTKTLQMMANTTVTYGKPTIETNYVLKGNIAGLVGMTAPPLRGQLSLSFPKNSILLIVENMLGEKNTEITQEVSDAVGELTNMIYGTAKTTLNQLGYNFEMALPTVINGDFHMKTPSAGATLVLPVKLSPTDEFFVGISVS